jgi:uncharacterized protein YbcV (DUF1398 family)
MIVQYESEAAIFHQDDELSQIKVSDSEISVKSHKRVTNVKETSPFQPIIQEIVEAEKQEAPSTCLKFFSYIETEDHLVSYMIS